jgi:alpha-D-ribose 1-methylphosphonate 5-triphosphate synthase subunit PhnL
MIEIRDLCKSFTLHNQGAAVIPVMAGAKLRVARGEFRGYRILRTHRGND